ncbi:MAG TPA: LuxR C-terminal-related transcriptional regulator [Gaiellaceae bacterium]|nr:LuxR C-terminal-related transcriptional regulator [Gaiellaceae bacterium]
MASEKTAVSAAARTGSLGDTTLDAAIPRVIGQRGTTLVGRELERGAVERFVLELTEGPRALVIKGVAGIGKTTVWRLIFERAPQLPILSSRPVQTETKLAFASLADLLADVGDEVLAQLPAPQRLAIDVALLRAVPAEVAADARTVGTALLSLLRILAPVVVAVDDVQWLDRPSATALAFALRRLRDEPVGLLVAQRTDARIDTDPLGLERSFPSPVERVVVGPLSLGSLQHVIRLHLGKTLARPLLKRIADASAGNPLFALELARALPTDARVPAEAALPVPESLVELLRTRLERLSVRTRTTLLRTALLSAPTPELLSASDLEKAEQAGVIGREGDRIRFVHPLFASTLIASVSPSEVRREHRRLAELVADPEERARHLALGAEDADDEVADALEFAADRAIRRGAPDAAVELIELSARMTVSVAERARRRVLLGEYLLRAGDADQAELVVTRSLEDVAPGPARAQTLELLARILHVTGTSPGAVGRCKEGLAEAGDDLELKARLHATASLVSFHDFRAARDHAQEALELLATVEKPDSGLLGHALHAYATAEFYVSQSIPYDVVERALQLERIAPQPVVSDRISAALGAWLKYAGDFEGARHWLEETYRAAIEEGDEGSLPYALSHLPQLELWTGNWPASERVALEHLELAERTAQPDQRRQALYNLALVHAHMGRVDEAVAEAREVLGAARGTRDPWEEKIASAVLGFVELSRGRSADAVVWLGRQADIAERLGLPPSGADVDLAEALVETGDLDRAGSVLQRLEATPWPALAASAARASALLAAAQHDLEKAIRDLDEALRCHERVLIPFDRARTLLALGQVRRRAGERRAAREALRDAVAAFDALGAPLWSRRARAELERVPGRRTAGEGLTPTEQQVAELAATGRTNREIAQQLFITVKTVEANLSRIYRKLGVRSRAELIALGVQEQRDSEVIP